jgi:hypothetical protein
MLSPERIQAYRDETYRLRRPIASRDEAVAFVNERGYVYFWPIRETTLPSLWAAVAGDRPVPDEHDDPGHVTWGWKDELLGARVWHYAKALRKKATFISLDTLPYFYALSENYGSPEEDYQEQYRQGRLTWETKTVYETLLQQGPLDTVSLRRLARMTNRSSDSPFNRALESLQADFKILPVGVAQAGAWRYAFIYECVHRHYPDLAERARSIRQAEARVRLLELYARSVGAAPVRAVATLFGWAHGEIEAALHSLALAGIAQAGLTMAERPGEWFALANLVSA